MKLTSIFFILTFVLANCSGTKKNKSLEKFKDYVTKDKAIFISCNRCGCVIEDINKIDSSLLSKYEIFIDSNCTNGLSKKIKFTHFSQAKQDSTSLEFYNMLIIKKKSNDKVWIKLVEMDDSPNMKKLLSQD